MCSEREPGLWDAFVFLVVMLFLLIYGDICETWRQVRRYLPCLPNNKSGDADANS